jgi:uncharacterized RDD family membrane protein YckC
VTDAPSVGHAGLATRTLAFALDAAVINTVAWFVGAVVALCLSLFGVPEKALAVLAVFGAGVALLWTFGYFVFFWSTTGQTPGSRVLGIAVRDARTGGPPSARKATVRFFGLVLSALLLCLGFLLILVDRQRRGLHDRMAHTVVIYYTASPKVARHDARRELEQAYGGAVNGEQSAAVPPILAP